MCICTRCGETLTAPKFYNGYPYGYSCYEIVAGKKSNDKRQFVIAEATNPIPDSGYFHLTVNYKGKRYNLGTVLRDTEGKLHSPLVEFGADGIIYLVTHDRKGKALWKSIP